MIYVTAYQSANEQLTIGGFVSFLAAMMLLFPPMRRLTAVNAPLQRGIAAASSVFDLVDADNEPDYGTRTLGRTSGQLEFERVSFNYGNDRVNAVENVTLTIRPGEMVALVGPSGSGKSTIANLIPRFYEITDGVIRLDGEDIRDIRLADLRRQIALVNQDVVLFDDSVARNIAYGGMAHASREAIEAAARSAFVMDFVDELPDGLDTEVGERGVRLSGGQRQRIAVARAFLKDAPILILDEATSALDNESERQVQKALEQLRQGRSTLVIAHRLSTIENADQIVVMANGRVVETGTHRELLDAGELYTGLYRYQLLGDDGAGEST
jgi:subfamily B ATP-binding cassette protein MsbA